MFHKVRFIIGFNIGFDGFSWLELADSIHFFRIRLNIETNSPLNSTNVDFVFSVAHSLR